jgi:hypothetical protein
MFNLIEVQSISKNYEDTVFESILPYLDSFKELSMAFHGVNFGENHKSCFSIISHFYDVNPEIHRITCGIEDSIEKVSSHFNIPVWYLKSVCNQLHHFMDLEQSKFYRF